MKDRAACLTGSLMVHNHACKSQEPCLTHVAANVKRGIMLAAGVVCAMKDVKQTMVELNVQLDNLCQVSKA